MNRDLKHIHDLAGRSSLDRLKRKEYRDLLVISELYRQQKQMYQQGVRRIEGRIVSISQPHVRPIVRDKASVPVEFGAKISVSLVGGYAFVDRLSWENYNAAGDLIGQIETYRQRFGVYPESVHADQIYRNRENRAIVRAKRYGYRGPS